MSEISPLNERGAPRDLYEEPDTMLFKTRPRPGESREQWLRRHPWVVVLHCVKILDRSYAPPKCVGIALTGAIELKNGTYIKHWNAIANDPIRYPSLILAISQVRQHCKDKGIVMENRA